MDSSGFVSLFTYMNIVYGYICDMAFFDENLNPIQLTATIVILLVAVGIATYKLQQKKKAIEIAEDEDVDFTTAD